MDNTNNELGFRLAHIGVNAADRAEAEKIARAERSRNARLRRAAAKGPGRPSRPKTGRPSRPKKTAGAQAYGDDWSEFQDEDFPEYTEAVKEEFAQRVRDAAASVAPPALQSRIRRLSTEALWKAYEEDQYIFEVYFQYHQPWDTPHTSDISVWLYQVVRRIEQYMGVSI